MITSPGDNSALSNLGWIDRGSIWQYEVGTRSSCTHKAGDASYLRLALSADSDIFTALHGLDGRCAITLHRWDSVPDSVVRIDIDDWAPRVTGELAEFPDIRTHFVSYLNDNATGAAGYYLITIDRTDVVTRRLDWFDDEKYDAGYQSVMSVLELPSAQLLFGVQRSSELVLCDPNDLRVIKEAPLAGRHGNPNSLLRADGSELWAVDYDTVVRLDASNLAVQDRWRAQEPIDGSGMFVGRPWLARDETALVLPRPGSGDVVAIDPESLQVIKTWRTGQQPLAAALVMGDLVARNWKSGDLLLASEPA